MSFQDSATSLHSRLHLGRVRLSGFIGVVVICIIVIVAVILGLTQSVSAEEFELIRVNDEVIDEDVTVDDALDGNDESLSIAAKDDALASDPSQDAVAGAALAQICVHVGGCVCVPGIYYIDEGSRVIDAVEAAGGLSEGAATDAINLARELSDGEQVIVPSLEQVESGSVPATASSSAGTDNQGTTVTGKININTADSTQLQTLSGIGEVTAQKIIDDREENGAFASIEDIKRVSGIGDKKFEAIKDDICVN